MSIIRKSLVMIGGSAATLFLSAVQGIIVARILEPAGTGQYQLAITLSITVTTFFIFGIGQANIFFLNHHKADPQRIVANSILFSVLTGFLAALTLYFIFSFGQKYMGRFSNGVELIFSLSLLFMLLQAVMGQILIAEMRVMEFNISQLATKSVAVLLIGALACTGVLTAGSALVAVALSQVLAFFLTLLFLRNHLSLCFTPDFTLLWKTIRYGLQLYTVNLLLILDQYISMIFIGLLMPGEFAALGYYSRAVAICSLIRLVPFSLQNMLYSHWAGLNEKQKVSQIEKALRIYLIVGITIVAGIYLAGRYLIIILYGKTFLPAYPVLLILGVQQVMWMMSNVFQSFFSSSGMPMLTTCNLIITTGLSAVGMVLLIPPMGIVGAAWCITVAHLVSVVINFILARKFFGLSIINCFHVNLNDISSLWKELKWKAT